MIVIIGAWHTFQSCYSTWMGGPTRVVFAELVDRKLEGMKRARASELK